MPGVFKKMWRAAIERLMTSLLRTREGRRALSKALPPQIRDLTYQADDHLIAFNPREVLGRNVLADGSWMRGDTERVLALLDEHGALTPGKHALELGGHIGTQTLYLALSGRFDGVVTVEPSPRNLELLRRNVASNGLDARVRVIEGAIAAEEGTVDLYLSTRNSGAHSILDLGKTAEKVQVRAMRLETALEQAEVDASQIGFVWMDVEGLEDALLPELLDVLGPGVPVFFEYSPGLMGAERARALAQAALEAYDQVFVFEAPNAPPEVVATVEQLAAIEQADLLVFSNAPR